MINPEEVARQIRAGLTGADVQVVSDHNTHFAARIVAREFAGSAQPSRATSWSTAP
jgi:acid stress-induced BolA-like protein IbaG/YrbA